VLPGRRGAFFFGAGLAGRPVVDGVPESVIEVELQTVRELPAEGGGQAAITGLAVIHPHRHGAPCWAKKV